MVGVDLAAVRSQLTVSACRCPHRCTGRQRVESEPFCSQKLFYIVLPDCPLHTSYMMMLHKSVAIACTRVFLQSVVKTYCDHIRRRGGEAQLCCLPISEILNKRLQILVVL